MQQGPAAEIAVLASDYKRQTQESHTGAQMPGSAQTRQQSLVMQPWSQCQSTQLKWAYLAITHGAAGSEPPRATRQGVCGQVLGGPGWARAPAPHALRATNTVNVRPLRVDELAVTVMSQMPACGVTSSEVDCPAVAT